MFQSIHCENVCVWNAGLVSPWNQYLLNIFRLNAAFSDHGDDDDDDDDAMLVEKLSVQVIFIKLKVN